MIPAGNLRHVIAIQERTEIDDPEYGGESQEWTDFATDIRAEMKPMLGREVIAAQAAQSEAKVRFRMRYIPGIDSTMQIVESGQAYEIVAPPVDINGMGRWLEIMTKAVVSGA